MKNLIKLFFLVTIISYNFLNYNFIFADQDIVKNYNVTSEIPEGIKFSIELLNYDDIDDIQVKTKGNIEQFLVNLLLMDLVAMTDKNWNSPYRRDPGVSGFIPDFSGSRVDNLTQSIVNLSEQLTDSRGIRFFRLYIENLDTKKKREVKYLELTKTNFSRWSANKLL